MRKDFENIGARLASSCTSGKQCVRTLKMGDVRGLLGAVRIKSDSKILHSFAGH